MPKIALVVPTIREDQIKEFLVSWSGQIVEADVNVYIVEDNPRKSFELNMETLNTHSGRESSSLIEHLCWEDAPDGMLDCITVKSPSCRQIGMWKAYHDMCEIIITLDDDVRPAVGPNIFIDFYKILVDGVPVWVDPLLNYRSRGYPTQNVGTVPISFHVGSFLGIPDVDGETQLKHEKQFAANPPEYIPQVTIVPRGQLIPVNGGICGWKREITPFVHYTRWNKKLGYRRFDDIWMGIIVKKLFDQWHLNMSYGPPFVNHVRASSAEKNIEYEVEGKKWNEVFWEVFDTRIGKRLDEVERSLVRTYEMLAKMLEEIENDWTKDEAACMLKWMNFFNVDELL